MTLRTDPRQWLIHERGPIEAVVRALETMALAMVGRRLTNHHHISVRAVGTVMQRLAAARTRHHLAGTDDQRTSLQHVIAVANWAIDGGPEPTVALDEVHAAVFHLDSRLVSAGMSGPGWERDLGRGD